MANRTSSGATRIPTIRPGQRIRASYLNQIATVINDRVLNAPVDIDQGAQEDIVSFAWRNELGRVSEIIRIIQLDENGNLVPENFVDVDRAQSITFLDTSTGEIVTDYYRSS